MERWLFIGAALTLLSGIVGFSLLSVTQMNNAPSLAVLPLWLLLMAGVGSIFLLRKSILLAFSGERRPISALRSQFDWKRAGYAYLGCFCLSLNLAMFGAIKPQLAQLTPFVADPILAEADHYLFGVDPWLLLTWFGHPGLSAIYHEGWFLWLAFVSMYAVTREPSVAKDRALSSYFLIWSIFGPLVHLSMPAAGPIFFDELGLGDRFSAIPLSDSTQQTANYLWSGLVNREFNAGGGISAMPSIHLATMAWSSIVLHRTRWFASSVVFTGYIFLSSIALGWHYAVDGIVGVLGAGLIYCFTAKVLTSGNAGSKDAGLEQ